MEREHKRRGARGAAPTAHEVEPAILPTSGRRDLSDAIGPARFNGIKRERAEAAERLNRALAREHGSAQPLNPALRQRAEKSLGTSVADVRVHAGTDAARANAEMGSRAFALGNDIVLGAGIDNSANPILAHEVAHTVQQQGAAPGVAAKMERDSSGSAHERDADQAADRMMLGVPARVSQVGAPRIQRFDSFEHRALGDAGGGGQKVTLDCGLQLSYGEVVALSGDFFGSPEKLMKAERGEVERLLAIISTQAKDAAKNPSGRPDAKQSAEHEKEFEKATMHREDEVFDGSGEKIGTKGGLQGTEDKSYTSLAKENIDHFSPRNMEMQYAPEHAKAIALAAQARDASGEQKAKLMNEAFLHDGFASHFLTDAFASGHLMSGDKGREIGTEFYKTHHAEIFEALVCALVDDLHVSPNEAQTAVGAIMGIAESECGSLCLKLVHDMLNESGLEVQNRRGDTWQTKGDDNLASAPRTKQIASEAVRLSREEIEQAAKTGVSPEPRAVNLVPALIGYKGQVYTVEQFTHNPLIFERYLRPLLLERSKNNPLYKLVKGNLDLVGVSVEESAGKYGRRGRAEIEKAHAGENAAYGAIGDEIAADARAVGRAAKSAARGVADALTGNQEMMPPLKYHR